MATAELAIEKIRMVYKSSGPNGEAEVELPFRVLVVGNFSGDDNAEFFEEQMPLAVTIATFDQVLSRVLGQLKLHIENRLEDKEDHPLSISLTFHSLASFEPESIISQIPQLERLITLRETLASHRNGSITATELATLLSEYREDSSTGAIHDIIIQSLESVDSPIIDACVAEIDELVGNQLDEILHHPAFSLLEASWRSLYFLVERCPIDEPCSVEILNVSKTALAESFEDVPEVIQSPLYQRVYSEEFGQYGGQPYSCIIGNYAFNAATPDVWLLQQIASVCAMSHAPFIAAAAPEFFDIDHISGLARLRDLSANFSQPKFAKWNSFRQSEDARYIALTLPGFLLRDSYDSDEQSSIYRFNYKERYPKKTNGLWGNAAFAFVTRLIDSFATTRWCINIVGEEFGKVDGLSMRSNNARATKEQRIPTEVLISDRRETELVKWGFLPLTVHKGTNSAAFYSSNSVQAEKSFADSPAGQAARINHLLGSRLAYLIIISRLSHYIKMMQREHIGSWKNRSDIQRELNEWLRQYVSDMDNPTASVRARRPLRHAQIAVEEVEGKAGWYMVKIAVTPHLKYMGASFTLNETGKLDKA